jgi:hypothetical protein
MPAHNDFPEISLVVEKILADPEQVMASSADSMCAGAQTPAELQAR